MDAEGNQTDPAGGSRPIPTLTSMLAVGGGLLVAAGSFFLLDEVDGFEERGVAVTISLLFVALGVAISTMNRSNRSAAAGVVISALAVVPLTLYLFADGDVFAGLGGSDVGGDPLGGLRGTLTWILAAAAALWLLGYLLGPARRFGFYLGAALVAIWLIPIVNIQISSYEDLLTSFETSSPFTPGPFDSSIDSGSDVGSDPGSEFDSGFDSGFSLEEPAFEAPAIPDPSTKLGVISLGFGLVYLAFAAVRDHRGDARMATAALAPALVILLYALSSLTTHVGWVGIGLLGIGVGGAILAVGLRAGRRASSWIGVAVATIGLGWMLARPLQESPRAIGAVLTVVGVVIVLALGVTARPPEPDDAPRAGPGPDPFGSPEPTVAPPASPVGVPPSAPGFSGPQFHAPTPPPAGPPPESPPWTKPF